MKEKLKKISTALLIFIMSICFLGEYSIATHKGNLSDIDNIRENVLSHLNVLTSLEFEGRMVGSDGNQKTVAYIEEFLRGNGYNSDNENIYKRKFETAAIYKENKTQFRVLDKNGVIIENFQEGEDFLTRVDNFSMGGTFKGDFYHVTQYVEIIGTDSRFQNLAVLVDYQDENVTRNDFDERRVNERLTMEGANVIIYPERQENLFEQRNLQLGTKNTWIPESGPIVIGVRPELFDKLILYQNSGAQIELQADLSFKNVDTNNIFAVIPSKSKFYDNYIMLATSIDGLGIGPEGELYPSASDNALSTAILLELAREMIQNDIAFDSTIVFAFFNAKHTGYTGVQHYQHNSLFPLARTEVIFLDKISGNNENKLMINTFQNPNAKRKLSKKLVNKLATVAESINYEITNDDLYRNAEHLVFRQNGVVASVLTHGYGQKIGTPLDTVDNINLEIIEEISYLILNYLDQYANMNPFLELEYSLIASRWMILLIGLLMIGKAIHTKKATLQEKPKWKCMHKFPIYTMGCVFILLTIVLMLQSQHAVTIQNGQTISDIILTREVVVHRLLENIFTSFGILMYIISAIIPMIVCIIILELFFDEINNKIYLLLVSLVGFVTQIIYFTSFYRNDYVAVFPQILSNNLSNFIMPSVITLIAIFITLIFWKEKRINNRHTLVIFYMCTMFILVLFTFSPYIFDKQMIELRNVGSRILL